MTQEEMLTALYEKMAAEQDKYRDWLKSQPAAEVLNHAYEYTVREDIVMCMEELELTEAQAKALLASPTPLADVYGGLGAAPSTSNLGSSRQRKSQVWPLWVPRGIACRFLVPRIYALSGVISSNEKRGRLHILLLIIRIFQFDGSVNDTFHNGQILLRAKL